MAKKQNDDPFAPDLTLFEPLDEPTFVDEPEAKIDFLALSKTEPLAGPVEPAIVSPATQVIDPEPAVQARNCFAWDLPQI